MSEFPKSVNGSLSQLGPLHNVYTSVAQQKDGMDTDHVAATQEKDPVAELGNNPSVTDLARLLLNDLGGRIDKVRSAQGVLASSIAQNTKDVEFHSRQIEWIQQ